MSFFFFYFNISFIFFCCCFCRSSCIFLLRSFSCGPQQPIVYVYLIFPFSVLFYRFDFGLACYFVRFVLLFSFISLSRSLRVVYLLLLLLLLLQFLLLLCWYSFTLRECFFSCRSLCFCGLFSLSLLRLSLSSSLAHSLVYALRFQLFFNGVQFNIFDARVYTNISPFGQ